MMKHTSDPEVAAAVKKARVAVAGLNKGDKIDLGDLVVNLKDSLGKIKKGVNVAEDVLGRLTEAVDAAEELSSEIKKRI